MPENSWFKRNISKRRLIEEDKNKVTYLQIIGFCIIGGGILYMIGSRIIESSSPEGMGISFFLIMLGMAFAFPSLLQGGDKEMSTMRLAVFMMVNVICLLLIKIGWGSEIRSLEGIGLDQYWMGVIAFIFGAKATQSFFENRTTRQKEKDNSPSSNSAQDIESTYNPPRGNAQLAINANKQTLMKEHPGIKDLTASYYFEGTRRTPCVDIFISGKTKDTLPDFLEYKESIGSTIRIKTRVITNYGNAKPHVGRGHFIANDNTRAFLGTACCILEGDDPDHRYLLTCNHVLTAGKFEDSSKPKQKAVRFFSGNEYDEVGNWEFGRMNELVDAAVIDIEKTERIEPNDIDSTIYNVTEDDFSLTEVELKGAFSRTQRAFIIHNDQSVDIDYKNETVTMTGLITISTNLDHFNFNPPTRKGDSGALVYHLNTRQPIGMVVGANTQFSFVIPISVVLNAFPDLNLKLLNS